MSLAVLCAGGSGCRCHHCAGGCACVSWWHRGQLVWQNQGGWAQSLPHGSWAGGQWCCPSWKGWTHWVEEHMLKINIPCYTFRKYMFKSTAVPIKIHQLKLIWKSDFVKLTHQSISPLGSAKLRVSHFQLSWSRKTPLADPAGEGKWWFPLEGQN